MHIYTHTHTHTHAAMNAHTHACTVATTHACTFIVRTHVHLHATRATVMRSVIARRCTDRSVTHLVEVCDDLVKKPKTFDSVVVRLQLSVELGEVRDRSEHHRHVITSLVVQLRLRTSPSRYHTPRGTAATENITVTLSHPSWYNCD